MPKRTNRDESEAPQERKRRRPRAKNKVQAQENKKERDKTTSRRQPGCCEVMIWNIPKELRNDFKSACKKRNITMREAYIKFMQRFVERA